jgi:hypothetical protein
MGSIRGAAAQAPSIVAYRDRATLSQLVTPGGTFTQVAPLPPAQINKGSVLNTTTGVFTPAISGYYRISGSLLSTTGLGSTTNYAYLNQGSTILLNLASDTGAPAGVTSTMGFASIAYLTAGTPYHLRFWSALANTINELQLSIELVSV